MADNNPTPRKRRRTRGPPATASTAPKPATASVTAADQPTEYSNKTPDVQQQIQDLRESIITLTNLVQSLVAQQPLPTTAPSVQANTVGVPPPNPTTGEFSNYNPSNSPVIYAGSLQPGLHLTQTTREKIAAGKYIDFHDILYPDAEQTYDMTLAGPSSGPLLSFSLRKCRQLTETEWY